MPNQTFPKAEHICLRREIDALFSTDNRAFTAYPVRAVCRVFSTESVPRIKVLVSVGKRHLRHAVDRNRAKRQLREAYRTRKASLSDVLPEGKGLHIAFIWMSDKPETTARVEHALARLLHNIEEYVQTFSEA